MNYAITIEHEPGKAYGVQVPDLPGCFSAGEGGCAADEPPELLSGAVSAESADAIGLESVAMDCC